MKKNSLQLGLVELLFCSFKSLLKDFHHKTNLYK